ncbi:antitoxin [Nocardiopsis coralliicola]
MGQLQRLLRRVLTLVRKDPHKADRHLHTAADAVKRRTGGKYDRHINKAAGAASKYLRKQARRPGRGSHGPVPPYRPDGRDPRWDR